MAVVRVWSGQARRGEARQGQGWDGADQEKLIRSVKGDVLDRRSKQDGHQGGEGEDRENERKAREGGAKSNLSDGHASGPGTTPQD